MFQSALYILLNWFSGPINNNPPGQYDIGPEVFLRFCFQIIQIFQNYHNLEFFSQN